MNGSNIDARNSIHRSPLRGTYLLIAGLLGGFGLFIALALRVSLRERKPLTPHRLRIRR